MTALFFTISEWNGSVQFLQITKSFGTFILWISYQKDRMRKWEICYGWKDQIVTFYVIRNFILWQYVISFIVYRNIYQFDLIQNFSFQRYDSFTILFPWCSTMHKDVQSGIYSSTISKQEIFFLLFINFW